MRPFPAPLFAALCMHVTCTVVAVTCPAGYYCVSGTQKPCAPGTFSLGGATSCVVWSTCLSGTYQSTPPTNTFNRNCTVWRPACSPGQYQSQTPNSTIDRVCVACPSEPCALGSYQSFCGTSTDWLCSQCQTCGPGKFNSACGGTSNGTCKNCTECAESGATTLSQCSTLQNTVCGNQVCQPGYNCGILYCMYGIENSCPVNTVRWGPAYPSAGDWLCKKSLNRGTCQPCPVGWTSDDLTGSCVQCKNGVSCDWLGVPVQGMTSCNVGYYPVLLEAQGVQGCLPCTPHVAVVDLLPNAVISRGGVYYPNNVTMSLAACFSYFTCNTGYVAVFTQPSLTCTPCQSVSGLIPISHGLTQGDIYSCLYALPMATSHSNQAGFWGQYSTKCPQGYTSVAGAADSASDCIICPMLLGTHLDPKQGGVVLSSPVCAIECLPPFVLLGMACISHLTCSGCATTPGYYIEFPNTATITYVAQPLPWNSAGFTRDPSTNFPIHSTILALNKTTAQTGSLVWVDDATDTVATTTNLYTRTVQNIIGMADLTPQRVCKTEPTVCTDVQDNALFAKVCTAGPKQYHRIYMVQKFGAYMFVQLERSFGTNNRYVMWQVDSTDEVLARWRLPGKVFSVTYSEISQIPYLYITFVSTSIVSFVRADKTGCPEVTCSNAIISICTNVRVLAGTDIPGQADGLRDTAQFETQLSIAVASYDPKRVFVADTHNCRLAEIWIDTPGSWLTQVGTIVAACWNEGAVPYPQMLTSVLNGAMLLFSTDNGIMQMDPLLRDLLLVIPQDQIAIPFTWIGANETSIRLWNNANVQIYTLNEVACGPHKRSLVGGICTECGSHEYAMGDGCFQCTTTTCPNGYELLPCSDSADATCSQCTNTPTFPHRYIGTCCRVVPISPCPIGWYAAKLGHDCIQCPDTMWGTTLTTNSTSVNDCVCTHNGILQNNSNCLVPSPYADAVLAPNSTLAMPPGWLLSLGCTAEQQYQSTAFCAVLCPCTDALPLCGPTGLYLQQVNPRICSQCPPGTVGINGLHCAYCKGLRDATKLGDYCMCRPPAVWVPPSSCGCPPGHHLNDNGSACVQCPASTIRKALHVLSDTLDQPSDSLKCDECPPGFTSDESSTTCQPCPTGLYRETGQPTCRACPDPDTYARNASDSSSCGPCASTCAPGYKPTPCPINTKAFECQECPQLGPDQTWVETSTNLDCYWTCPSHNYIGAEGCRVCTPLQCPPCFLLEPCSTYADANCNTLCTNTTMPMENAHFLTGCAWGCDEGYNEVDSTYTGWVDYACVQK